MIFWILIVLLGLGIIYAFVWPFLDVFGESWLGNVVFGFLTAMIVALVGGMVGFGILALVSLAIPTTLHSQAHDELRAVSASSSIEGRFYLGSGYVDGKRVLNYITAEDGYSELKQADASASRVFEDEGADPYVISYDWAKDAWWWIPGAFPMGTTYDFHIPPASILEDFTVDNGAS